MNKLSLFAATTSLLLLGTIGCTRIDSAHVGIKVSMAGSNRGVQDIPVTTGWVFYNPLATRVIEYPSFVQSAVWTKDEKEGSKNNEEISFNSKDGLVFFADINLSYQLRPDLAPHFYLKYKADEIATFTHGLMRQNARDEFSVIATQYTAEEIYGEKKEEFIGKVRERLNEKFKVVGLSIDSLGFIGAPRPPVDFTNAVNNKLVAKQKTEQSKNELLMAQAEAAKQIAYAEGKAKATIIEADAEMTKNKKVASSLSPELIEWIKWTRWQGHWPDTYVSGSATPLLSINPSKGSK